MVKPATVKPPVAFCDGEELREVPLCTVGACAEKSTHRSPSDRNVYWCDFHANRSRVKRPIVLCGDRKAEDTKALSIMLARMI
jgi:hypothetical protein